MKHRNLCDSKEQNIIKNLEQQNMHYSRRKKQDRAADPKYSVPGSENLSNMKKKMEGK